ncbi:hypothetical protein DSO57_1004211 [Entomophthora muscae]|uniref:Uncharacterized protein n=1 Tax=Entomophthora muscae TaxID=34485 RepID=A0ACC2RN11_9FUNG|nr:hypothetical protein DSO57_1004211 [Entomophthora muscae]
MTPPLTPRPDHPLEPTAAAKTTSTQLFGVLYITLTGLVDSMVPNSRPWSLLGQSLAPILWWALPAGLAASHPKPPNASTYDWLPDKLNQGLSSIVLNPAVTCSVDRSIYGFVLEFAMQKIKSWSLSLDPYLELYLSLGIANSDAQDSWISRETFWAWKALHFGDKQHVVCSMILC